MKKIQPQIVSENSFFHEVSNLFTGSTKVFFNHIIWNKEDQRCVQSDIEKILEDFSDEAEQLHRIAEYIRIDFVEAYTPSTEDLCAPYRDILFPEIYNCDNFAIAKELLKQYNEKIKAAA